MKLIKASQFAVDYFDADSAPSLRTITDWVKEKKVPGTFIGTRCYIDIDAFIFGIIHETPATPTSKDTFLCELV